MATINAAVDGIVLTADSSATLNLQVGGSAAISIGTGATTTISNATITSLTISNPSTFPAGSASAPAITTTGDTNTGIYFPAADQVAVTAGGTVAAAFNTNGLFFRNRIINGDMRIDQRNAGASGTSAAPGYPVDRWAYNASQANKITWQQNAGSVTPPAGYTNYLGITSSSAYSVTGNDYFQVYQIIEGNNVADLAWGTADARPAALSFWVRSSLTGTFGGSIATTKTAVWELMFNYTISAANTWTYVTVAIPAPTSTGGANTDNSAGVFVRFGLGSAGSSAGGTVGAWQQANYIQPSGTVSVVGTNGATWYITGVQLESGSVATPFERRPYGTELMLCQRYFEKSFPIGTAVASGGATTTIVQYLFSTYGTAAGWFSGVFYKVTKRANPTVTIYNTTLSTSGNWAFFNGSWQSVTTATNNGDDVGFGLSGTGSGWTAGDCWPAAGHWTASAEL
jgi:hypothetical protein